MVDSVVPTMRISAKGRCFPLQVTCPKMLASVRFCCVLVVFTSAFAYCEALRVNEATQKAARMKKALRHIV